MGLPVISVDEMRAWEQATWDVGIKETDVIDQVGAAIAAWVNKHSPSARNILILAGKGHNGDDGRAAQEYLNGHTNLLEIPDPEAALDTVTAELNKGPDLILDCLFGIGLNRPLSAPWQQLIDTINACPAPIISVDVPSGLCAATGRPLDRALRADVTLTVGAPKAALLQHDALRYVGYLRVLADVGLAPLTARSDIWFSEAADFQGYPEPKRPHDHKGTHGHLVIVAGSMGYHGACVLAARAAIRAQPGLISLFTQSECYIPVASQLQQVMTGVWQPDWAPPAKTTALLYGPGLAAPSIPEALVARFRETWTTSPLPMIADASALDWLPQGETPSGAIRIITPHIGEAARLLDQNTAAVASNPLESLRNLSSQFGGCWVVLKQSHTLIGRDQGRCYYNATGNTGLAQGGSGDVLAGFLAGCFAQPRFQVNPELSIRLAVWRHGEAAERLGQTGQPYGIKALAGAVRPG